MASRFLRLGDSRVGPNNQSAWKLPEKLPCYRCGVTKSQAAFAKNRINDLSYTGLNHETKKKLVCVQCNGAPVTELFCVGCDKNKGLDSFSHTQRNNPDHAKCRICIYKQVEAAPGAMKEDSDADSEEDDDPDFVIHSSDAASSITGALNKITLSSAGSTGQGLGRGDDDPVKNSSVQKTITRPSTFLSSTAGRGISGDGSKPGISTIRSGNQKTSSHVLSSASIETGASGFARVRAYPRKNERPHDDDDDDVEVVESDDEGEWEM